MDGVVVGSGFLLAFTLKEDNFDAKLPLIKRAPATSNSEYYTQFELNYNVTILLDVNNNIRQFTLRSWLADADVIILIS